MKIGFNIDTKLNDSKMGKLKFILRLAKELENKGIDIDNASPDIFLGLPKYPLSPTTKINVLRLDGVTFNTLKKVYKKRVKELFKLINKSDAIVYQSSFCKDAHNKFLGVKDNKDFVIIPNGASPDEFLPRNPKNYFLAGAKWRNRKRLKDIIKSYLIALDRGLDSDLVIAGEPDYQYNHHRIKYLKWQNKKEMNKLLSEAIASLHLNWLDCCPNSMVESIVAECPVIYTKSGGQEEIAKNSGIGVRDEIWDFKPYNTNTPPKINRKEVAIAMLKIKEQNMIINKRKDLYISKISDKYISFFESLLREFKT